MLGFVVWRNVWIGRVVVENVEIASQIGETLTYCIRCGELDPLALEARSWCVQVVLDVVVVVAAAAATRVSMIRLANCRPPILLNRRRRQR